MQPDSRVRQEYLDAFREVVARIAKTLANAPRKTLPVRMYVAGGAALYFHAGGRVSEDIDAVFSRRVALPRDLEVSYRDADGLARFLYFDRQYNDTFGLLHEGAYDDSLPLALEGIDASVVEVRLLSPLDLAVSKIARLSDPDRDDIARLAQFGLVKADALRRRAEEALGGFVGDVERLSNSIEIAYRIAQDAERQAPGKPKRR